MKFSLPILPYHNKALEPYISQESILFHYEKHHQTYVNNLNKLIINTEFNKCSLEEIIKKTAGEKKFLGIFNNAAQVWNHTFYWNSLSPKPISPTEQLTNKIKEDFGSFEEFKKSFIKSALDNFGSGWTWLVLDERRLRIINTKNAETPLITSQTPILTCDVWEHAYYIDYRNRRLDYIKSFLDKLANWDFAAKNLMKNNLY